MCVSDLSLNYVARLVFEIQSMHVPLPNVNVHCVKPRRRGHSLGYVVQMMCYHKVRS